MDILEQAKALKDWSVEHRRYLHQHAEVALQEKNTAKYCKDIMQNLGYKITDCWGYGFYADLDIPNATKRVAFRADMDALPMHEMNTHDFVSQNPEAAHMCGHDVHMAIALTTARLLQENQTKLNCNIRFIFQPSEEMIPGGALGMIEKGCLDGVNEIYGLHTGAASPVGTIGLRVGTLLAANATFALTITGKGCHAARPQRGLNPLLAAAYIIDDWQTIPQQVNNKETPVLSICQCNAGTAENIIPESAKLAGTMRALQTQDLDKMQQLMLSSLKELEVRGYKHDLVIERGYDCVVNPPEGVDRVVAAAQEIIAETNIHTDIATIMASEDYCYYLQHKPGAFYFLGAGNAAKGIDAELHSPYYDVDEDCMPIGAAIMAEIALQTQDK